MKRFTALIVLIVAVLMTATLGMAADIEHQSRDATTQLAVLSNVVDHVGIVMLDQTVLHNKDPWSGERVAIDYRFAIANQSTVIFTSTDRLLPVARRTYSLDERRVRGKTTAATQRTRAVSLGQRI